MDFSPFPPDLTIRHVLRDDMDRNLKPFLKMPKTIEFLDADQSIFKSNEEKMFTFYMSFRKQNI